MLQTSNKNLKAFPHCSCHSRDITWHKIKTPAKHYILKNKKNKLHFSQRDNHFLSVFQEFRGL